MKRVHIPSAGIFSLVFVFLLAGVSCTSPPTHIFLVTLDTRPADYIDYSLSGIDYAYQVIFYPGRRDEKF
ncbi:MAG: hypothetical protein JSV88_00705 [Candidatus Aminicenantes bacterium]|nr:MAG: hypothetical protein JSV88_00705 [Candidatus Aminicenantes bacterium]